MRKSLFYSTTLISLLLCSPLSRLHSQNSDSLPTEFGFNGAVHVLVEQSDGKILCGGNFTSFNGKKIGAGIARLNSDGSLDQDFASNTAGKFSEAYFSSILILPDGKIFLGGTYKPSNKSNESSRSFALLAENGVIEAYVGGDTKKINGLVEAMAYQGPGKILIGGDFAIPNQSPINGFARISETGVLDVAFLSRLKDGFNKDATITEIEIQDDGKILIAGSITHFQKLKVNGIVRLSPEGDLDKEFHAKSSKGFFHGFSLMTPGESDANLGPFIPDMDLQLNGDILIAGEFVAYGEKNKVFATRVLRLSKDGETDLSFVKNFFSYGIRGEVNAIESSKEGNILVGSDQPLTLLDSEGFHSKKFLKKAGGGLSGRIYSILFTADDQILLAGEFQSFNRIKVGNIVKLSPKGSLVESFLRAGYR